MYKGSCLCGSIRYEVTTELGDFGYCHCTSCRKASGSAHAANAPVDRVHFHLIGEGAIREYESSPGKFRAFCSDCGSPIFAYLTSTPEVIRLRLGTLDTPFTKQPKAHTFVAHKAPWEPITDNLPQFEQWAPRAVLDQRGSRQGGIDSVKNPRIREATLRDISELARLVAQLGYPTSPSEMQSRLHTILEDPDYHTLVADSGAGLAGLVGIRLGRYYEKSGTFAQIAALVVGEAERGSGVGALLLREAESWAASRSATDVWVNSHRRRRDAHQFYEAHGYENTGFRFRKVLEPVSNREHG